MELNEVKKKIDAWHRTGLSREDAIVLVSALPINSGDEAEAFQYVDIKYETTVEATLPEIIVTNRSLKDKTADTMVAVERANNPPQTFERGGHMVRVNKDECGIPYIEPLSENAFRGFIERAASYLRVTDKGDSMPLPAPPLEVVRDYMSLPKRNLPPLLAITESPVMRADGSILSRRGYDVATRLYYEPAQGLTVPEVPDNPTESELQAAITLVQEPLVDFPFDSMASRTNALAAMITTIYRPMIPGLVPMCLFDKPMAGTGASLCSEVIAIIATGRPAAMISAPRDDEEWQKKLTAMLRRGRSVIIIDNLEGTLYSPSLAMILTSHTIEARILGQSETILLQNRITFIATGNNVRLGGDLPRRLYYSRMDALDARPWMRDPKSFKYEHLIQWATEHRGELLAAIMTLARSWIMAGRSSAPDLPVLGGFEDWTNTVGGILAHAGIQGFLGNLDIMYSRSDVETTQWEGFLEACYEKFGNDPITGADIIREVHSDDDFKAALPDSLADGLDKKNFSNRLGKALGKKEGVRFPNGLTISKGDKVVHHAVIWKVGSFRQANSPALDTKGEFGEFAQHLTQEQKKEEVDIHRTKLPKLPSRYKKGEFADDLPPVYPTTPCQCGCVDYWLTDDNRWLCKRCHPEPQR